MAGEELRECLRQIEMHCPCGARPESPRTHPHVISCPVEKALVCAQADAARLEAAEREILDAWSQWIREHTTAPFTIEPCGSCAWCDRIWMHDFQSRRAARAPETTEGKCWCHLAMIVPRVHHCDTPLNGTPYPK